MKKSKYKETDIGVDLEIIGKKIHAYRLQRDMKIDALAKNIGVNKGTISKIENGQYKSLTYLLLSLIAKNLSINITDII